MTIASSGPQKSLPFALDLIPYLTTTDTTPRAVILQSVETCREFMLCHIVADSGFDDRSSKATEKDIMRKEHVLALLNLPSLAESFNHELLRMFPLHLCVALAVLSHNEGL